MYIVVPSNCENCLYYSKNLYVCRYDNTPTGNINTCKHWKMHLDLLQSPTIHMPVEYKQYWIDK